MSTKHQKQLFTFIDRIHKLEQSEREDHFIVEDIIYEAINCFQTLKIRELQELKLEITEMENKLRREKERLETAELRRFDYCYRIINDSIQKRRES